VALIRRHQNMQVRILWFHERVGFMPLSVCDSKASDERAELPYRAND
jgi:hypothetical protein